MGQAFLPVYYKATDKNVRPTATPPYSPPSVEEGVRNDMEIGLNRVAKAIIRRALREDLGKRGDITTRATIPTERVGEATITARSEGIVAGQRIAEGVFRALDRNIDYKTVVPDGDRVKEDDETTRIKGKLWAILAGERTALNFLGRCGGIATLTDRFVRAVEGTGVRISETRKTAPGLRYLDKAAVRAGGGVNHRYALYDAFLIKENHIAGVGGIREAIEACRRFADKHGRFRVMVEARNPDEFREAVAARPDRILLDNMTPDQVRACVDECNSISGSADIPVRVVASSMKPGQQAVRATHRPELETTGGITLENVREYALTGVDFISLGALTHSVKTLDLSLLVVT